MEFDTQIWTPSYYILRDRLPLLVLLLYFKFRDSKYNTLISSTLVSTNMVILVVSVGAWLTDLSSPNELLEIWNYAGILEWSVYILIMSALLRREHENTLYNVTLAVLAGCAGGWLYEIPRFTVLDMNPILLDSRYALFLGSQIISFLILLYQWGRKPRTLVPIFVFMLWVIFSVFYTNVAFIRMLPLEAWKWIVRVPTMIALGILVLDIAVDEI